MRILVALSSLLQWTPPSFQQCRRAAEVAAFVRLPSQLGQIGNSFIDVAAIEGGDRLSARGKTTRSGSANGGR